MTSHHVICHVTAVTCLFIIKKKKENQKKRYIKSRKIDKRKRKMLVFKYTITIQFTGCSMQNSVYYGPSPNLLAFQTLIIILFLCLSIILSLLLVSSIT